MITLNQIRSGKISWQSPSNIALVKYWGKKPLQIPANPSLSMTLSRATTEMTFEFFPKKNSDKPFLEFLFEGEPNEKFWEKIRNYLLSMADEFPVINDHCFRISSTNSFPHSTGIASSASSMSALGLCLAEFLAGGENSFSMQDASRFSRLASGSACRSVYGGFVVWGRLPNITGTSDEFAVPLPFNVHPAFAALKDSILVVSSKEKEVSSRAGHSLMDNHPFAASRYDIAMSNMFSLTKALVSGDMAEFIRITESEALTLHALMMSSNPSYLLIQPNTLNIIKAVRNFRQETSVPVCFTLDAGPNVHLIYPGANEKSVMDWINNELKGYCENGIWIDDTMGNGPVRQET